jgi:hypothetical protein
MSVINHQRSKYFKANKYLGVIIEIFPAIQYPMDPAVNYRAEAKYIYVKKGWSREIDFSAYGYSDSDAVGKDEGSKYGLAGSDCMSYESNVRG